MNYLFQMKKSKNQKDCFHYAAKIANIDVLKKATEGDLNKRDEDGRTPTHWAAFKGNINALILIVSKGYKFILRSVSQNYYYFVCIEEILKNVIILEILLFIMQFVGAVYFV